MEIKLPLSGFGVRTPTVADFTAGKLLPNVSRYDLTTTIDFTYLRHSRSIPPLLSFLRNKP